MLYPAKQGFALLVTIVLLAFLVLLLVSLSALTRVETQVAANSQSLSLARQNALFGLNVALGQLQRYAGPDQRITGPANLTEGSPNPFYTGVWNVAAVNAEAATNSPLSPTSLPAANAPDNWLVSGNEVTPLTITHTTDTSDAALFETLIGANTASQTVRAKKVPISSDSAPGINTSVPIGQYAYWVGDEGVKAKFNLIDPYTPRPAVDDQPAFTPTSLEADYRQAIAQRFGVEQVSTAGGVRLLTQGFTPTANTQDAARLMRDQGRVLSYASASAALPAFDSATSRVRYHDVTTNSFGLLTDTAAGGLKYDLTWDFSHPRNPADPQLLDGPIFLGKCLETGPTYWPTGNYADANSEKSRVLNPRWSVLRDFYRLGELSGTVDMAGEIPIATNAERTFTAVNNAITPVFVQLRVYLGAESSPAGVNIRTHVMFLLANPYNAPLRVPAGLAFLPNVASGTGDLKVSLVEGTTRLPTRRVLVFKQFTTHGFTCPDELVFQPGEVKALTLPADITSTTAPVPLEAKVNIDTAFVTEITAPTLPGGANYKLALSIEPGNVGWFGIAIRKDAATTEPLQDIKAIEFSIPANSATTYYDLGKIGGIVLTLKMPAEPGYDADRCMRLFADTNLRSQYLGRFKGDNSIAFHSYYNQNPTSYSENLVPSAFWGLATSEPHGRGSGETVLFDIPRRPAGVSTSHPVVVSLAHLQHANISNASTQPAYAFGNSYASIFCQAERSISVAHPRIGSTLYSPSWYYDMSYLLNEALWDRYYFSTVPQRAGDYNPASSADRLANTRHTPRPRPNASTALTQADLTANSTAAATHLHVNGAFNINSTSVEAWRTIFSALHGLSENGETNLNAPFFRSRNQPGGSTNAALGLSDDSWTGFRNLTSAQIDQLAIKMVDQVRLRGPFRSLGDFVNRRLRAASDDPNGLRLRGALQAAIDAAGINDAFDSTGTASKGNDPSAATFAYSADMLSSQWIIPGNAVGNRGTGAPGWLMQADVLQAIGPWLSARSDTFVIRTYGETINPTTQEITGRAWCEAVVQRTVDFVDSTAATGNQPADALSDLKPTNQSFGRRFQVVGFRWLSPNDL